MSVRRATAQTVTIVCVDPTLRPARKSGVTFTAGDCQISKDGGAFSNTTNLPTELDSTGRYYLALTATEMDAGWVHVKVEDPLIDPVDLLIGTSNDPSATVLTDAGNSSTQFKTSRTEAVNDYWKDCLLVFTSGTLLGQVKKVSAYNGTTKIITLSTALTGTPSVADQFILINK